MASTKYSDMDDGKLKALFQFCFLAAKEGGYTGQFVDDVASSTHHYFIPMISALVREKLVSDESEFDEAKYVLEQHSSEIIHTQLNTDLAKAGNPLEVMKFVAALAYEFRWTRTLIFTSLCESMPRTHQLQMAHFVSFMDKAVKPEEGLLDVDSNNWWKILFMSYSDDDLNQLAVSMCNTPQKTPHKTPSRHLATSEYATADSPIDSILNSPSGKERRLQELERRLKQYERRLNNETRFSQSIQSEYDNAITEIGRLKSENESLQEQLEKAKRNATSVCGEDCPNLNETAGMRLRMNIQANKIQQMSAELSAAQQESSDLLTTLESLQNEVKKLNEQNDYFASENSRLRESFDELLEVRTKLAAIKRERDELEVLLSTSDVASAKTELLAKENETLKAELENTQQRLERTTSDLVAVQRKHAALAEEVRILKAQLAAKQVVPRPTMPIKYQLSPVLEPIREPASFVITPVPAASTNHEVPPPTQTTPLASTRQRPLSAPMPREPLVELPNSFTFIPFEPQPKGFKYNEANRLKELQARNKKTKAHLRSHYATELDNGFSPSQTMKFNNK